MLEMSVELDAFGVEQRLADDFQRLQCDNLTEAARLQALSELLLRQDCGISVLS
jgi:hypothetical protein